MHTVGYGQQHIYTHTQTHTQHNKNQRKSCARKRRSLARHVAVISRPEHRAYPVCEHTLEAHTFAHEHIRSVEWINIVFVICDADIQCERLVCDVKMFPPTNFGKINFIYELADPADPANDRIIFTNIEKFSQQTLGIQLKNIELYYLKLYYHDRFSISENRKQKS